jgi:hypothetical protein
VLEIEEILPHPSENLHLTIGSSMQKLENLHLGLQVVVNDRQGDLPLAYYSAWKNDSFVDELAWVKLRVELMMLVGEGIGRDQSLKICLVNIIDEGDSLIFKMDHQHIVEYVQAWKTITGQLDGYLLLVRLDQGSELQLTFIGVIKEHVGSILNSLNVNKVIFCLVFLMMKHFFIIATSL